MSKIAEFWKLTFFTEITLTEGNRKEIGFNLANLAVEIDFLRMYNRFLFTFSFSGEVSKPIVLIFTSTWAWQA